MHTCAEKGVGRLTFTRLGELNVFDKVVQDLFLFRAKASIVRLVPIEIENARGNAMGNVVLVRILTLMA